jgi:hypothetical protein
MAIYSHPKSGNAITRWFSELYECSYEALRNMFGLDVRSLALFRILSGVLLLLDLWIRYQTIDDFLTDEGVLPVAYAMEKSGLHIWSLHFIGTNRFIQVSF